MAHSSIHAAVKQSCHCEGSGITYTDSLLIGGEFTEDVLSVGPADAHLREGCKFLRHLIQQSPHLQQKHRSSNRGHVVSVGGVASYGQLTGSPLCSCAQSGAAGDTAPVWFDASPRTHRKPSPSRLAGTTV